MMLTATAKRGNEILAEQEAINDVVVGRGSLVRVVRLRTSIDGNILTTYAGDGLIVSTATGSTAYALAAGGPILPPTLKNIVLVPIAPHLSLDKPVVLWQRSVVEMQIQTDVDAAMTADGQAEVRLLHGDIVTVQVSPNVAQFVRVQQQAYFYQTLMRRLMRPEAVPTLPT
jgi:NAD+ kinase